MAGARLTPEDREQIAAGLAERLDYAEIARRLGRPTSTVSREVARNLRRGTYAPRPLPSAPVGVPDFDERFTALMVESGLSRMASRLLTALVTTDAGTLTAAELVARLRVSPASVSKAVAYLEALSIVRRERVAGRRERYVIDDDVWLRTWQTSADQHARWGAAARAGALEYGGAAGARLERMGQFFEKLSQTMAHDYDPAVAEDMLTVIAALVHASAPRSSVELAAALGWPVERVSAALALAERPGFADPVAPLIGPDGRYIAVANTDRLTPDQRAALRS
ncbi:MarR family transcriptional regulator [Dactylosporangium sp. CS-033363]|uniref:GbsR/MarR family transcriptional regulator n=1 Tax=Dactylosporangium sp. CS-033363 TaxID=3239935 RepID=UPI003D8B3B1B